MAEQANETQPKTLKSSSRILLEMYGEQLGYTTGWGGCQNCTPQSDSGQRCCSPSSGELDRLKRIVQDDPQMLRRVKSLQGQSQWRNRAQNQVVSINQTMNDAFKRLNEAINNRWPT